MTRVNQGMCSLLLQQVELDFCVDALKRALLKGQPEIFNSGQGSQFTRFTRARRTLTFVRS